MKKFYLFYPCGNVDEYMFLDVDNLEKIDIRRKPCKNPIIRFIEKVHLSPKLNKIIPLPFRRIWYNFSDVGKNPNDEYHCFFLCGAFVNIDAKIVKRVLRKKNCHAYLITLDPFESLTPVPTSVRRAVKIINFEKIYTHDYMESQKYGFQYMDEMIFSNKIADGVDCTNDVDLYFLGRFKSGRGSNLFELFEYITSHGVNFRCKMQITKTGLKDADIDELKFKDQIEYFSEFMKYIDVVKESAHSNCILEMIQDTESDTTLRYFEAVLLNKKLLTNNKNIVKMKYYNPKYIKVFEKLEDIDCDWIKRQEKVDYGYKGDFSSKLFFEKEIEKLSK